MRVGRILAGESGAHLADAYLEVRQQFHAGLQFVDPGVRPVAVELDAALDTVPGGVAVVVELALNGGLDELLKVVKGRTVNAKVRTGGIETELIPPAPLLARFLEACASAGVPFKATAGLHHAVRGEHPLTYEAEAENLASDDIVSSLLDNIEVP